MCLYFVSMNGFARSEEVVTESALRVSRCIPILCITLTKDTMFEIAQTLSKASIDWIGLSLVCTCPPPIDSSLWWDHQRLSWWASCCSGSQSSDRRIARGMNKLGSLGDFAWYQSRSNHRTQQVEWPFVHPSRGSHECQVHPWNQSYVGTESRYNRTTRHSWIWRRACQSWYWARQWSHWAVITSRDRHSLIIAVSNHIRHVHVVEHSLGHLGSKQDSHGSDGWILVLVGIDPFERSVGEWTLDELGVVWVNRRFVVHSLISLP